MIAEQSVESLKGVGPSLKGKLERLGIFRVGDLLLHLPLRYQDRSRVVPLRDVHPQQECLVQGQVVLGVLYTRPHMSCYCSTRDSLWCSCRVNKMSCYSL